MKKVLPVLLLIIVSLVLLSSCTVESVAPDDSWESVFLQFWNEMNMEYVHFDNETDLDWDEVYDKYLPLFRKLDYSDINDTLTAFTYFKEIAINIDDGHFQLIVRDNFSNCLMMSPATERKWMAATESGNSNGFPDVIWNRSTPSHIKSVDGTYDKPYNSDTTSFYEAAIKDYSEVKNLIGSVNKTNPTEWGNFHSGTNFLSSIGYRFISVEQEDPKKDLTDEELAWNSFLDSFGIGGFSYYYGVTSDNIFYFYFSSFIEYSGTPLSNGEIYKKGLTDEEIAALSSDAQSAYESLWKSSYGYDYSSYVPFIEGIYNMFEALKSIGKTGKCEIKDSSGNVTEYDVTGVIMDVRGNSGGANSTLETIFGSFFSNETKFGEARYKDGYNRYEYSPWMDLTIEKEYCNAKEDYKNPFVIITNDNSISCAELSASIVKNLMKNGIVVGNTTYGATCTMVNRFLYHSGPFSSKNLGVTTTTYETKLRTKDGSYASFENKGIEPTEGQKVDVNSTYATDARFEAAVRAAKGESSST